jgi:hypothetical protein
MYSTKPLTTLTKLGNAMWLHAMFSDKILPIEMITQGWK